MATAGHPFNIQKILEFLVSVVRPVTSGSLASRPDLDELGHRIVVESPPVEVAPLSILPLQ